MSARKARACFCASSVCALCGLLIACMGLTVLVSMCVEKKNASDADADLWIVLTMLICCGLALAVIGFCCGNCSMCCCNGQSKVADDLEGISDTPVKGWGGQEED